LKVNRVERHLIKKSDSMWKTIDDYCLISKNVYNEANYLIRQEFFKNGKWIRHRDLDKVMQHYDCYKMLGSQASQNLLRLLDKNWKSFFIAIKDWSKKNGVGYLGKPVPPKYKEKINGRNILMIKNIQCKIINSTIYFSWKPLNKFSGIKTRVNGKLQQIRFIPSGNCYWMEIVYETNVPDINKDANRIIGIDLGINNFATIANNTDLKSIVIKGGVIKSMNRYYNKEKSRIQKETGMVWNNRLRNLTDKHMRKLDYFMHITSKFVVDYCLTNNIDTIIIGKNNEWKQYVNMGHVNNQNFVCIPFNKFIDKVKYKCENVGINFIANEENFTSGTSFLDGELPIKENYNIKRRINRGLFESNNNIKINADLNASYQIIKKVFPNAFNDKGNRGCDLHPVAIKIQQMGLKTQ